MTTPPSPSPKGRMTLEKYCEFCGGLVTVPSLHGLSRCIPGPRGDGVIPTTLTDGHAVGAAPSTKDNNGVSAIRAVPPSPNEERGTAPVTLRELQRINAARAVRWIGGTRPWSLLEIAGEMCGEAGEAANAAKKVLRVDNGVPGNAISEQGGTERAGLVAKVGRELADVIIVAARLATACGVDMESVVADVFNAKSEAMGFPERIGATPPPPDETPPLTESEIAHAEFPRGDLLEFHGEDGRDAVEAFDRLSEQHQALESRYNESWGMLEAVRAALQSLHADHRALVLDNERLEREANGDVDLIQEQTEEIDRLRAALRGAQETEALLRGSIDSQGRNHERHRQNMAVQLRGAEERAAEMEREYNHQVMLTESFARVHFAPSSKPLPTIGRDDLIAKGMRPEAADEVQRFIDAAQVSGKHAVADLKAELTRLRAERDSAKSDLARALDRESALHIDSDDRAKRADQFFRAWGSLVVVTGGPKMQMSEDPLTEWIEAVLVHVDGKLSRLRIEWDSAIRRAQEANGFEARCEDALAELASVVELQDWDTPADVVTPAVALVQRLRAENEGLRKERGQLQTLVREMERWMDAENIGGANLSRRVAALAPLSVEDEWNYCGTGHHENCNALDADPARGPRGQKPCNCHDWREQNLAASHPSTEPERSNG